jgi:hypothetical protein
MEEGRWINYIFFPLLTLFSGKLLSFIILFSFTYFIFINTYKISKNILYGVLVSTLFVQLPPLYNQILWPATSLLAFLLLASSVYTVKFLPGYKFYIIYGILFFGTLSNLYYLLPLASLGYYASNNTEINYKLIILKIIPMWALGFIAGYFTTQFIIFILSGHLMQISDWRQPHYIHSFQDLTQNFLHSFNTLVSDFHYIIPNELILAIFAFVLISALLVNKINLLIPIFIIFFSIIIVHYVIILPIGIVISPRTIIATWVGILSIVFIFTSVKNWQLLLLSPIVTFYTYYLYQTNQANLQWYKTITNTHYEELLNVSNDDAQSYNGVILVSTNHDISKINSAISKQYSLNPSRIESLDAFMRWSPIAHATGFKTAILCNQTESKNDLLKKTITATDICKQLNISSLIKKEKVDKENNIYIELGKYSNFLIITLNDNYNFSKVSK